MREKKNLDAPLLYWITSIRLVENVQNANNNKKTPKKNLISRHKLRAHNKRIYSYLIIIVNFCKLIWMMDNDDDDAFWSICDRKRKRESIIMVNQVINKVKQNIVFGKIGKGEGEEGTHCWVVHGTTQINNTCTFR